MPTPQDLFAKLEQIKAAVEALKAALVAAQTPPPDPPPPLVTADQIAEAISLADSILAVIG